MELNQTKCKSFFHVFGSEAWAHIPDEKHNALEPKSEKCLFVGYSEYVKGYRLLKPNSIEIIIRRDVKFNENVSTYEPDLTYVPSSACEPDLVVVPSSSSLLNKTHSDSSLDTDSDDENHPLPVPPLALAPSTTSQLPQWVLSSREAAGDIAGDPTNQRQRHSQF